jgi:hypothetical protein
MTTRSDKKHAAAFFKKNDPTTALGPARIETLTGPPLLPVLVILDSLPIVACFER